MKKLMALAAAVMMAVVANAGAVRWQCYDIGTDEGGEYDGVLAYLVVAEAASLDNTVYADALSNRSFTGLGLTVANVDWTEINTAVGSYGKGVDVSAYMILLDTDSLDTYANYKVSDVLMDTFGASGDIGYNFTNSIASTSWTAVSDVPEPTSGILLLLGMAGLALRRKRA